MNDSISGNDNKIYNKKSKINNTDLKDLTNFNNFDNLNYNKKKPLSVPYILNGDVFQILKIDNNNGSVTVRCRICPENNVYKGNVKSTGNFHMHIKRKHPSLLPVVNEMKIKSNNDRKARLPRRRNLPTANSTIDGCTLNKRSKSTKYERLDSASYILDNNEPIDYRPLQKKTNSINNVLHSSSVSLYSTQKQTHGIIYTNSLNLNQPSNNLPILPAHLSNYSMKSNQLPIHYYSEQYSCNETDGQGPSLGEPLRKTVSCPVGVVEQNQFINNEQVNFTSSQNSTLSQPSNGQLLPTLVPAIIQESLTRVESHLKGIEREMNLRNQIETNRIYLDLAKFKYLNPGFK